MVLASLLGLFGLFGLGALLWLLVAGAIYALPVFIGLTLALQLQEVQVEIVVAIAAGFLAGGLTLLLGQVLIALLRHPLLQATIAALYAAPAAFAGYHAVQGLAGLVIGSDALRTVLAAIGAVVIGGTAWIRMGDGGGTAPPGDPGGAVERPSR